MVGRVEGDGMGISYNTLRAAKARREEKEN